MSDANYDYIANAGGPRPNTISNVGGISPPPPPPPAPSWVPRAPSGNVATVFIGFATDQYWAGGATQTIAMLEGNTTVGEDWIPGNLIVSGKGFPLGNIGVDTQGAIIAGNLAGNLPAGYTAVITTLEGNVTSIDQTAFIGALNSDYSQYSTGSATISVGNLSTIGEQAPPGSGTASVTVSLANPSKAAFLEIGNQTNSVSVNGGNVTTGNVGAITVDAIAFGVGSGGSGNVAYVGNIAIWGPEPEADLPALSTP